MSTPSTVGGITTLQDTSSHRISTSSVDRLVVELTCLLIKIICLLQKLTKISSTVATALYTLANDGDPPKDDIKADDALVSVTQLRNNHSLRDKPL